MNLKSILALRNVFFYKKNRHLINFIKILKINCSVGNYKKIHLIYDCLKNT